MTKAELWQTYCRRNPFLAGDEPVKLRPEAIKAMFDQTWDQATKAAGADAAGDVSGLFDSILNGKRR